MPYYSHPLDGQQILPRAVFQVRPSAIAGLTAATVYDFWKSEFEQFSTMGVGGNQPADSERENLNGTDDLIGSASADWRMVPGVTNSAYTSWSGRFCQTFFRDNNALTTGYAYPAIIDMTAITGYTVPEYYAGRQHGWCGVFIGERDNPYYMIKNSVISSNLHNDGYYSSSFPNDGTKQMYKFPLGASADSTEVLCWLVIRMTLTNRVDNVTDIPGYESVGVEYFIESVDTITPGADVEFHIFTIPEGTYAQNSAGQVLTASDGDSFMLTGGHSHYIGLREELQPGIEMSGTVVDGDTPIERDIYILDAASMGIVGGTRSAPDGSWSYTVVQGTEYCVICRDEGATPRNSLIFDHVYGVPTV